MLNGKPVLCLPWRKVCHLRPVGRKPPPRRAMVPRASQAIALVLMVISPAARALTTTTSSSETSDPSCATLQVAAASTARSFPDCPAVLVSVTLTASTEDCATDIQMSMEMEEYPRDVNTFGGESSAALEDKTITWSAPALTASTSLSVEFRLDLCGFCDTYDNGKFNPIDSFQYQDAEGNEPNDRKKGYQLKLDCEGIEGDPVESIVATPAPILPVTPAPVAATMSPVTTPGPTELEAATPAPKPTTAAPEAVETVAPSSLEAAQSSEAPVGTPAPVEATMAPLATRAPTVVLTMAPSSSTDTVAPSSIGAVPSSPAPVGTPAPVEATTAPLATEAPAAATPGPTELEVITPSPVSATAPPVATATGAPSAIEATPRSVAPVGTPAPADTTAATPEPTELEVTTPSPVSATVSPVATATGAPSSIEAAPPSAAPVRTPAPVDATTAPLATKVPAAATPGPTELEVTTPSPVSTTAPPVATATGAPSSFGAAPPSAAPVRTPAPVDATTPPIATQAPAAATPEPTEPEAITSAPVSVTLPPVATATGAPSSLGAAPPSAAPVRTPAPADTTTPPIATQAPAPATPEPTELEVITSAPASTTAPPVATATGAPSSIGAPAPSVAPVGTPAPVDATTAPRATQAPAVTTPEPTEPEAITSAPVPATAPPVATVTGAPSSLGAAPPSAAPVGSPAPAEADPRATRAPEAFILAPPETGDGATTAPTGADRGIGGAPSSSLASSASSTTSAEGGESLTSSTSSGSASERQGSSGEESIAESDGTGTGSSSISSVSSISSISSTGVSDGASGEDSRGISSESYGSASDGASTAAPTSVGSTVATTVGSTAAPSLGSSDGSRGYFFSASPTTAPTGAPTSLGGESLQGVTLEIQSIFEARRRALAADVSNDVLERRALSAVYAEDAEEYDEEMVDVCASLVGVPREDIISVSTDFGPDGPAEDAGRRRRGLMTSSSSEESGVTATQLTPITTCEVDLSDASDTRAMTAATMVDRMLLPENFVLMMNANQYGPVNAAVTSISFWQNECPADACPAVGDGSFAAVFPVDSTLENQSSMVEDDDDDGKESLFWFVVVAAVLTMFAVLTWCSFCLCCGGSTKRRRRPKETPEDLYTVKSPTEDNLVKSPLRKQRFATQVVVESDEYPSTGTPPGPSPTTPPRTRPKSNRRRAPPPPLSTSPRAMARRDARIAEPPSPGEADWRKKFGLGPLRDYTLRSAPVSPRRTTPTGSGGSTKTSSTDPFFGAYPDNVVAAADGKRKLVLPPLMNDATAAMESQSTWQISDEMNANVQHSIDPVVRSSLSKAGVMVANALTSPRRELNRLKEALNKPSRLHASPSISPTVTASSADPSSAPGFGGSEGGFSPGSNYGNNQFASSHFNNVNVSSPIYEIDLEAEENGGAAAGNAAATATAGAGAAGGGDGRDGRVGQATVVVTRGMSGEEEGATPSPSSSTSTRKSGRNPFAKAPGSVSSRGSSRGPPSSPSDMSTSTDRSETNASGGGGGAFSTLATAAAVAEAKVGVMSPTGRAVHALASAGGAGGSDDTGFRDTGESHAVGSSGVLSSDPTGGGAEPHATKSFPKPLEGEEEGKSPYPATAVRVPSPGRYGGASSGFGCLAPQLSPRVACSRLPEIDDEDEDEDEDANRGGGGGSDRVGHEATSSGHRPSLTLSLPGSASARGGSDLMPIAEAAGKEFFTDSETESEVSSRASSLSSARSGARRTPRDPAALLAAALQRAGQVAAIPPPSAGSPGQIGKPLSSVQEVPMEAIPLPGLYTPTATACSTPGQCAGGSCWGGEEGTEELPCPSPRAAGDEAVTPIPSPASRPGGLVYGVNGGAGESVKVTSPAGRSPARSREEAEDEREEHRVWEKAMGYNTAGAATGGGGAQELVSPSETIGGLGQGAAPAASSGSPLERDSAPLEEVAGAGAPGFSLVGTLVAFFGRKRGEVAPPAIPEKEVSRAAPIHLPEDSESSDFMQSPESHAVDTWPDAIVEDGSKSSLDEGFVDVPVADVEIEDEADDEVVFKLPQKETPVDLPALVVPDEETGDFTESGQRVFNRASMNLQSPGPELARTPEDAPMPALPKQPSPSVSMASSAMKTPVTGTNPSRISEASPMYDREAIAKAMSQAHADLDDDKGSDVILPSGAWPSERRQKPYIAGSSSSSGSDITSSSGSSYNGSGSSYTGSGSTSSGSSSSGGNASARGSNNTHRF